MNKGKIISNIVLGVGGLSFILMVRLLTIDGAELLQSPDAQDYTVAPMLYIAYLMIVLGVSGILFFYFKGLTNGTKLKQTVFVALGILAVVGLCFAIASGNDPSVNQSSTSDFLVRLVETGLLLFYLLIAVLAVLIFLPKLRQLKK